MRIKDYQNGYCIVVKRYWDNYGNNAFVEEFVKDEYQAELICASYSRNDRLDFVIIKV